MVSGPKIATPFCGLVVILSFFRGTIIGNISGVFGFPSSSSPSSPSIIKPSFFLGFISNSSGETGSANFSSATFSGLSISSSSSIISGPFVGIFFAFLMGGGNIGSIIFFSSISSICGFVTTFIILLSFNFFRRASLSKPLFVSSTIRGAAILGFAVLAKISFTIPSSSDGSDKTEATTSAASDLSFFATIGFRGFFSPFITTATRSLSSTLGFIINFCFISSKGLLITYII